VDKPPGITSHDVVARVRRALGTRAAGHTGTLDPFATGLLVVLVGRATRLARFVEQQAKTYLATARLGVRTATDDLTGEVVGPAVAPPAGPPTRQAVEQALAAFLGPLRQRPPAYSAKRVEGERSYRKARRGEMLALPEVDIVVHALEVVGYRYPDLEFRATVSPGTYIRALARDLGDRLGTGAHLRALRREAIGPLSVDQAVPLEQVGPGQVLPPLAVLGHLPRVEVTEDEARALGYGQTVRRYDGKQVSGSGDHLPPYRPTALPPDAIAAVAPGERFVAIVRARDGALYPEVVLEPSA
jgi:tRNA pseudouridine55 synthase